MVESYDVIAGRDEDELTDACRTKHKIFLSVRWYEGCARDISYVLT